MGKTKAVASLTIFQGDGCTLHIDGIEVNPVKYGRAKGVVKLCMCDLYARARIAKDTPTSSLARAVGGVRVANGGRPHCRVRDGPATKSTFWCNPDALSPELKTLLRVDDDAEPIPIVSLGALAIGHNTSIDNFTASDSFIINLDSITGTLNPTVCAVAIQCLAAMMSHLEPGARDSPQKRDIVAAWDNLHHGEHGTCSPHTDVSVPFNTLTPQEKQATVWRAYNTWKTSLDTWKARPRANPDDSDDPDDPVLTMRVEVRAFMIGSELDTFRRHDPAP